MATKEAIANGSIPEGPLYLDAAVKTGADPRVREEWTRLQELRLELDELDRRAHAVLAGDEEEEDRRGRGIEEQADALLRGEEIDDGPGVDTSEIVARIRRRQRVLRKAVEKQERVFGTVFTEATRDLAESVRPAYAEFLEKRLVPVLLQLGHLADLEAEFFRSLHTASKGTIYLQKVPRLTGYLERFRLGELGPRDADSPFQSVLTKMLEEFEEEYGVTP